MVFSSSKSYNDIGGETMNFKGKFQQMRREKKLSEIFYGNVKAYECIYYGGIVR